MIESWHWKEHLRNVSKSISGHWSQKRWSEKLMVNTEKDVIVGFFIIRKLAELNKLTDQQKEMKYQINCCKAVREVNSKNVLGFHDVYDVDTMSKKTKNLIFICNQFIHSRVVYLLRGGNRKWDSIWVCSDYEMKDMIYRVSVDTVAQIFRDVVEDEVTVLQSKYNPERGDFDTHVF